MPEEKGITVADLLLLDPDGAFPARLAQDRGMLAGLARGLWKASAETRRRRLAEIEALAHRLGGAAGTFGYGAVSAAAFELEDGLAAGGAALEASESRAAIEAGLASLLRALDEALEVRPDNQH
jgi:HPt (histidine-containing phosphotransfer) domain-containing protein